MPSEAERFAAYDRAAKTTVAGPDSWPHKAIAVKVGDIEWRCLLCDEPGPVLDEEVLFGHIHAVHPETPLHTIWRS